MWYIICNRLAKDSNVGGWAALTWRRASKKALLPLVSPDFFLLVRIRETRRLSCCRSIKVR